MSGELGIADRIRLAREGRGQSGPTVDVRDSPSPTARSTATLRDRLIVDLRSQATDELDEGQLRAVATARLQEMLAESDAPMTAETRANLVTQVCADVLGFGPFDELLRDDSITDIMTCGPRNVWVERRGRLEVAPVQFTDEAHLRRHVDRMVAQIGRRLDEASPKVDARLPDGSRVHVIIPPLAVDGTVVTIRKFARDRLTIDDLQSLGALSVEAAEFLACATKAHLSILVVGGTGAGKTTMLNVLSEFISPSERIVTIEDLAELRLHHDHWIRLESRPSNAEGRGEVGLHELVKEALRMRPDRLVVGEIRDGRAAMEMLAAMNTGHTGSMGTVHANSPRDTFTRIRGMVAMSGYDVDPAAVYEEISRAIDLIVFCSRLPDGSKGVTHICEVTGMEKDAILMHDVFLRSPAARSTKTDPLRAVGTPPECLERMSDAGVVVDRALFIDGSGTG